MKISNEAKVGFLATIAILAAIWGYKFLKGEDVFDNTLTLYAAFDDVQQITKSSPVFYRGADVGQVKELIFDPNKPDKVVLELVIKQNFGIPKNAEAELFANGVLSGRAIMIRLDKRCTGDNCAVNGDYIKSRTLNALESMIGKPESLDPYVLKMTTAMNMLFDTVNYALRQPDNAVGNSLRDVQTTLQDLRKTTAILAQIMAASSSSLNSSLSDVAKITANLNANSEQINRIIKSTGDLTTKAGTIDFAKINSATEGVGVSVDELKKTLSETQKSLTELTMTLKKVNAGEGTVGQFATNDSVYHSLNMTLVQTQALMQDLRLNPKRYINLNPFRKYKTYVVPSQDPLMDTLQRRFNAIRQ